MQLFAQIDSEAGATENVFYSPLSVEQAFGLLHAGSGGTTRAQLESVFGWPEGEAADAMLARQRESVLDHGTSADLRLANALWLSDAFAFRSSYLADTRRFYDATARELGFGPNEANESARVINDWADENTDGMIPQVVTARDLTGGAVALLTNALFIEADWEHEFEDPALRPFLFGDGSERPFQLMQQTNQFALAERGRWRALRLPYEGDRFVMDVIMPERREVMETAPALDDIAALARQLGDAEPELVSVRLPKFEIEYEASLVNSLKSIGLTLPFDPEFADLYPMAEPGQRPLSVGGVRQLTRLQVFEEGTRAAAVTAISIVVTGARILPPHAEFTVDRPFIVVIRDLQSGAVLFIGRIAAPDAYEAPAD